MNVSYSPVTIAQIWERNGGNPSAVVSAVAVCLAESGGNTYAISPARDYGLWQINITNFASQGINSVTVFDPDVNAKVAIRMSGNGTNWAAWCTAWADPSNCGHGFVNPPQPGSPAGNQIGTARAALGNLAGPTATANPSGVQDRFTEAWAHVQNLHGPFARGIYGDIVNASDTIRRHIS